MRKLVAAVLVVIACSTSQGEDSPVPTSTPVPPGQVACFHFLEVAQDMQKGLLTIEELREGLKEVRVEAADAEAAIKEAAESVLVEITRIVSASNLGGAAAFVEAANSASLKGDLSARSDACVDQGYLVRPPQE